MVGILGVVEGRQMAGNARRWCSGKNLVGVALIAGHRDMRAGELELGGRVVIELATLPLRGGVANRTILRKTGGPVIGVLGVVEGRQMAGDARRWCSGKDVVNVALLAAHRDMCAAELELGGRVVIELAALPLRGGVADGAIL